MYLHTKFQVHRSSGYKTCPANRRTTTTDDGRRRTTRDGIGSHVSQKGRNFNSSQMSFWAIGQNAPLPQSVASKMHIILLRKISNLAATAFIWSAWVSTSNWASQWAVSPLENISIYCPSCNDTLCMMLSLTRNTKSSDFRPSQIPTENWVGFLTAAIVKTTMKCSHRF